MTKQQLYYTTCYNFVVIQYNMLLLNLQQEHRRELEYVLTLDSWTHRVHVLSRKALLVIIVNKITLE